MKLRTGLLLLGVCAGALLLSGCAMGFNRDWRAAEKGPGDGIQGRWKGEWLSEHNGHHGELKAVVTKTSPTTYRAHYYAKYLKILHYTYVATLTGQDADTNGIVHLEGEAKLPKLAGGVYTYKATSTPQKFESTYNSKYDHGHYEMARP